MSPRPSLSMSGITPDTGVVVFSVEVDNVDERLADVATVMVVDSSFGVVTESS